LASLTVRFVSLWELLMGFIKSNAFQTHQAGLCNLKQVVF
jgi:hypothetical protein